MGQKGTKQPARVLEPLPEDNAEHISGDISESASDEKENGVDTLGVAAVEAGYPDPEPPSSYVKLNEKHQSRNIQDDEKIDLALDLFHDEDGSIHNGIDEEMFNMYTPAPVGASFQKFYSKRSSTPLNPNYPTRVFHPPPSWMTPRDDSDDINASRISASSRQESFVMPRLKHVNTKLESNKSSLSKRERMLYEREQYEYRLFTTQFVESVTSPRGQVKGPLSVRDMLPTQRKDNQLKAGDDIDEADSLAIKHIQHTAESYSSLVNDLTSQISDDSLKVKVILSWISKQGIGRIKFGPKLPHPDTPNGYMHLIQEERGTYPVFFTLLCRTAGIKCVIIHGISKGSLYQVGSESTDELRNSWNAVFVDNEWKLVHPLWVCKGLSGRQQGGWMTIETDSKANSVVTTESKGREVHSLNEYFIFTNPEEFIYRNFPDDPKWQLLQHPVSIDDFVEMSYIRPSFFTNNFKLLSTDKCVLHSESGKPCEIKLGLENDVADSLVFGYTLSTKLDDNAHEEDVTEAINKNSKNLGNFVLIRKMTDSVSFEVRFPRKGVYLLRIYGGFHTQSPLWIMDVKLVCDTEISTPNPLPFDPGMVGWGPGPISETLGLFVPSHKNSVLDVINEVQTIIQFVIVKRLDVKAELHHCELASESLRSYIKHEIVEINEIKELRITVKSPGKGEFALRVDVLTKSEKLENACNYVIHTQQETAHQSFHMRKARRLLNEGKMTNDMNALGYAIQECEKHCVPANDPDFVGGRNRLEFLHCRKELQMALQVNRIHVAEHALFRTRKANLGKLFRKDIKRVELHLKEVLSLDEGGWSSKVPEIDRISLVELSHLRKPKQEVVQVITAMYLLLGLNDEQLASWNKVQQLLGEQEATLVEIARMEKYLDADAVELAYLSNNALDRVQDVLSIYTEEDIRRIDNTAAAFYQWVRTVHGKLRQILDKNDVKPERNNSPAMRSVVPKNTTSGTASVRPPSIIGQSRLASKR